MTLSILSAATAAGSLVLVTLAAHAAFTADTPVTSAIKLPVPVSQIVALPPRIGDTLRRFKLPRPGTPVPDITPPGLLSADGIFFLAPFDSGQSPHTRRQVVFPPADSY